MTGGADTDRLSRLIAFAGDVLDVCAVIGIDPILDGSMAVREHTCNFGLLVRDIDFNCAESEFPKLRDGLERAGIFCEIQPWQVLQARRDELKVEFGAIEAWLQGIDGPFESCELGCHTVRMVNAGDLRELYQRGLEATAGNPDEREKHARIATKLELLETMNQPH